MEDKQLFRFGEFSLSVDDRSLRRGDENIALTPKMYELLLVLVQNPNRIVEKDFLLRTVWPDSFVEEGNITFNIRQLRKALGDSAQEPIYIETIPRRGYRFLPEVESSSGDHRKDTRPIQEIAQVPQRRGLLRSRPTLGVLTFLLLAGVMGSAVWFSRSTATAGLPIFSMPFATEKLSTDGRVNHAAITPDGKTVVYVHMDGKKQSLWIRQLETSNNVQIVDPSEDFYGGLDISPDGSTIYVSRVPAPLGRKQFDIYRVPIVGGVPQKVVSDTQGWLSVSPNGERLSYVRCNYKNDDFCSLWVADARDGSDERKLVSRPRPLRIGDNQISPDGQKVAFAVGQSWTGSNDFSFMEVNIESGEEREITEQRFFNINFIAALPDQNGWLLSALKLPDKNYRIWRVPAGGGEPTQLTADSETYARVSLDAAGKVLVATRIEPDFKLNLYQTENAGAAPKLLADGSSVTFAPDNKIYYSTSMTGDYEIWSINADGADQRQLTNDPGNDIAPIISPDNKSIFFSSNRSGELQVWRMGLDGSNQTPVTSGEGGFPLRVSPDGQWLYYRSGLQSTLRKVSLQDGKEELAYVSRATDFAVSPDTSRIVQTWHNNNEYTFDIVSLSDNKVEATFRPPDTKGYPAYVIWSNDAKDFVYIFESEDHENRSLWFQAITDEKPRKVADLGPTEIFELSGFALANDTRSFIIAKGTWNHNAVLIKGLKP